MKKGEIVANVLAEVCGTQRDDVRWNGSEASYEAYVAKALPGRLWGISPEIEVTTCDDLRHLGIHCCPVCHNEYPDEKELAKLESGALAWLCCAPIRALRANVLGLKMNTRC